MKRKPVSFINLFALQNRTAGLFFSTVLVFWACALWSQAVLSRAPDESIQQFSQRNLPEGVEFAHPPLQIAFGPSEHSIVVLFRKVNDVDTNYTGWVFVPENGTGSYRKFILPPMKEIPGHFDITVEAVFAANNGTNSSRDLVVLYRYHRNGSKDDDGYASYVYHWDGKSFENLTGISEKLAGLRTAAAVRSKLRTLH